MTSPHTEQYEIREVGCPMTSKTHLSLIDGLLHESPSAWERFNRGYRPWLVDWAVHRFGFQPADADDVVQQVMMDLHREFEAQRKGDRPTFQHNGRVGAFRSWVKTIMHHRTLARVRSEHPRKPPPDGEKALHEFADPHSALSAHWNQEHERQVILQAWDAIRCEFTAKKWQPVAEVLFKEQPTGEVVKRFGIARRTLFNYLAEIKGRMKDLLQGMNDD
jgi:DNA-directed RNA polymerase specialized sigma24 family protein